jgi:hypothetical protein
MDVLRCTIYHERQPHNEENNERAEPNSAVACCLGHAIGDVHAPVKGNPLRTIPHSRQGACGAARCLGSTAALHAHMERMKRATCCARSAWKPSQDHSALATRRMQRYQMARQQQHSTHTWNACWGRHAAAQRPGPGRLCSDGSRALLEMSHSLTRAPRPRTPLSRSQHTLHPAGPVSPSPCATRATGERRAGAHWPLCGGSRRKPAASSHPNLPSATHTAHRLTRAGPSSPSPVARAPQESVFLGHLSSAVTVVAVCRTPCWVRWVRVRQVFFVTIGFPTFFCFHYGVPLV